MNSAASNPFHCIGPSPELFGINCGFTVLVAVHLQFERITVLPSIILHFKDLCFTIKLLALYSLYTSDVTHFHSLCVHHHFEWCSYVIINLEVKFFVFVVNYYYFFKFLFICFCCHLSYKEVFL